jgi:tRNA threonylcarbamoyladenosine biosynthesis protein TsaE
VINEIYRLEQLPDIAEQLFTEAGDSTCWCFTAEMGTGKTTLIKELCRQLGVKDEISSPTYALVHEYAGEDGPVFHIDAYRIKNEEEAFEAGLDEIVNGPDYCFVEWPEHVDKLLPMNYFSIHIYGEKSQRRITAAHHE